MTEEIYEFRVSAKELAYLKKLALQDESIASLITSLGGAPRTTIRLTRTEDDQLRDRLGWHLVMFGFDKNDSPNEQGRMLEDLLDKFFIP